MVKKEAPLRSGIYKVSLDPTRGHEQRGYRPVVIISPDTYNSTSNLVLICPITSKQKGYPFEVQCEGKKIHGVILVDQIRALDYRTRKLSFVEKLGTVTMQEVREKLVALIE